MKRIVSFVVALFFATTALWAYDFQSGDLYYNITSITSPYTVEVTYQSSSSSDNYKGLTSVTIPATVTYYGTTYSVTSIGEEAFSRCTGLTSITIPNSVTSIGYYAFYKCTGLTSVTIPNSVTSIGNYAFYNVPNIVYNGTATGSPWGARSVNGYVDGYLVYADATKTTLLACSRAASGTITIPNSVTSIVYQAFSGCTGLTSVTIPESVTSIGYRAFDNVPNIVYNGTATGSPWGARSVNGYVDGYLVYADATKTTLLACSSAASGTITIPNSVTGIGGYAFYGCTGLTSVTIGNSVTSIGEYAFCFCTSLTSVTIGNSVTSIGESAFSICTRLTSVTIPNSVTSIGNYAFSNVPNIVYNGTATGFPWGARSVNGYVDGYLVYADATKTTLLACYTTATGAITIPNSVTSIGESAFRDCTSLTSITIPNSVTSIGFRAFYGCTGLTSITIPNSVTSIWEYAFSGCTGLTSITIPNSVMKIGDNAFEGCTGLTSIVWNAKYCNGWSNYYTSPFYSIASQITSFTFGDEVDTIPYAICDNMRNLQSITIPESVKSIGGSAFFGCTGLTAIQVEAQTPPQCGTNSFYNVPKDIPVYIPCGTKEAYQAADTWSSFTNYIETPPYLLTVTTQDETIGFVRITKEATCADNTAVFEAVANEDYHFTQWSDGNTDNPRTIVVDEDITLTAQFISTPTAIDNISADTDTTPQKVLIDGQVLILRNNKTYTPTGVEVQ